MKFLEKPVTNHHMYGAIKKVHFYDALSSCRVITSDYSSRKLLKSRLPFPCTAYSRKSPVMLESDCLVIITISCHYAGFLCYSELLVVSVATFVAFSYPPLYQWLPGIFIVEWDDEKRNRNWHILYSVATRNTTRDTGRQFRLQSPSHNIRNYKSSIHVFCVVDRRDLHKSLSGLAQRNGDGRERRNRKKPQWQGRELLNCTKKKYLTRGPFSRFFKKKKTHILNRIDISWMTRKSAFIALIFGMLPLGQCF